MRSRSKDKGKLECTCRLRGCSNPFDGQANIGKGTVLVASGVFDRTPATDQRPRGATLAAARAPAAPSPGRRGPRFVCQVRERGSAVRASPAQHSFSQDRSSDDRGCPHGLLPHGRRQHLYSRWGARFAGEGVLLRTAKAFGPGSGAGTFQESIDGIADLTGLSVSRRSLEELLVDAARDFDIFYRERVPAPVPPVRSWWRQSMAGRDRYLGARGGT